MSDLQALLRSPQFWLIILPLLCMMGYALYQGVTQGWTCG